MATKPALQNSLMKSLDLEIAGGDYALRSAASVLKLMIENPDWHDDSSYAVRMLELMGAVAFKLLEGKGVHRALRPELELVVKASGH